MRGSEKITMTKEKDDVGSGAVVLLIILADAVENTIFYHHMYVELFPTHISYGI